MPRALRIVLLALLAVTVASACRRSAAAAEKKAAEAVEPASEEAPCPTGKPPKTKSAGEGIPRFGAGSPFNGDYKAPKVKKAKRIWAKSLLWDKAPELVVEKWLNQKPETKGKYLLIEFWATWCPPCRRSLPLLNKFHEKFGKELAVIAISDETEADVRKLKEPVHKFYSAIDTKKRMKDYIGVYGIPHAIIVEPEGHVVWEGFPLLKDYELTEALIERILAVGRKK